MPSESLTTLRMYIDDVSPDAMVVICEEMFS